MFIAEDDYGAVVDERTLALIKQQSDENRLKAEKLATEQVCGYLRGRYDIDSILAATGDERSPVIINVIVDIALYHMISWLPQRMGFEIREKRYKDAIAWLEAVQAFKISPDLPEATASDGSEVSEVIWGGDHNHKFDW